MNPSDLKTGLTSIVNTLNTIEVKGKDNLNKLLGCVMLLEKLIPELEKLEVKADAEHPAD